MKCAICHTGIKIYEFDMEQVFEGINPLTFRKANMHFDCCKDALEQIKFIPSKKPLFYGSRLDEYYSTKL